MLLFVVLLAAISDFIEGHNPSPDQWLMALILCLCDLVTIAGTIFFWELLK